MHAFGKAATLFPSLKSEERAPARHQTRNAYSPLNTPIVICLTQTRAHCRLRVERAERFTRGRVRARMRIAAVRTNISTTSTA